MIDELLYARETIELINFENRQLYLELTANIDTRLMFESLTQTDKLR
jgi:hypothetical protein